MIFLVLFNLLFFWGIYTNPYQMATSELLSTFFPTWVWQGRQWAKGRIPKYDANFWLVADAHPVVSTYYPFQCIGSLVRPKSIDKAWCFFCYILLSHYLLASIGWYLLLSRLFGTYTALLGAITFTYQTYHIKQQPCIVYTIAWFPWIAICPWLAIGMILLAGYYPLALYLLPMGLFLCHDPLQWGIGLVIGSIQLVPFLKYLPKTIRSAKSVEMEPGPWETNFYFGLIPIILIIMYPDWRLAWIGTWMVTSYLLRKILPRVYQRAWIVGAYGAIYISLSKIKIQYVWPILILQCFDLWLHNHSLIPTRPYCELYQKPSSAFETNRLVKYLESHLGEDERVSGLPFPLFTGLINNFKTLGYSGGMQLKLMAKWRHDTNPNGSGEHDYFRSNTDDEPLKRHRVRFAYTSKKIDWRPTPIRFLYENPDYC